MQKYRELIDNTNSKCGCNSLCSISVPWHIQSPSGGEELGKAGCQDSCKVCHLQLTADFSCSSWCLERGWHRCPIAWPVWLGWHVCRTHWTSDRCGKRSHPKVWHCFFTSRSRHGRHPENKAQDSNVRPLSIQTALPSNSTPYVWGST